MATIRIIGTANTTVLLRGEIVEVEHTDRVDRLLARGFAAPCPRPVPRDKRGHDHVARDVHPES